MALALLLAMGLAALNVILYMSCPTCSDVFGPAPLDDIRCWLILVAIVGVNLLIFRLLLARIRHSLLLTLAWPFALASGALAFWLALHYGYHIPLGKKPAQVRPLLEGCFGFFLVLWFNFASRRPQADEMRGERFR